jgi:hypothetical protein
VQPARKRQLLTAPTGSAGPGTRRIA